MGLIPFLGVPRRIRRIAFMLLVVAAVYAGPRFARDMIDAARGETTTTTTTVVYELPS